MHAADVQLLDHPFSPYAQKVRILLREKGISFEAISPGFSGGSAEAGRDRPTLSSTNPRAEVPVLLHEGARIFDSTIILEYLEERFPTPQMMPSSPAERARARAIEDICDTQWEAINWGLIEIAFFKRGGKELGRTLRESAASDLQHMFDWLETVLGPNDWAAGAQFGWADLVIIPYFFMSRLLGVQPAETSRLGGWLERCQSRPSVALTLKEAEDAMAGMVNVDKMLKSGKFRRQYRDHRLEWMIRAGGMQVVLDGLAENTVRFNDLSQFSAER